MRKGQAAMEFLMTYGWAILVVLVAIGALAYFGVLSPGKFLPETCIIGPGFACDDFKIVADGTTTVLVRNGGKDALYNLDWTVLKEGGVSADGACLPTTVPIGTQTKCEVTAAAEIAKLAGTAGDRFKGTVTLTYNAGSATGLSHSKVGDLVVKYE